MIMYLDKIKFTTIRLSYFIGKTMNNTVKLESSLMTFYQQQQKKKKKKNINQRFNTKKPYQKSKQYHEYQSNILFRYVFYQKI